MDAQMQSMNLEYEFFDAVDGRNLSREQLALVDHEWRLKRKGEPLPAGQIGCAMSHGLLYKKMVDEGIKEAIILEDDAVLTKQFLSVVNGCLEEVKAPLVVLHAYPRTWAKKGREKINGEFSLYEFLGRPLGTCGYYIRQSAAAELVTHALPVFTVPDWPTDISKKLDARGIDPACVLHGEDLFDTQIQIYANRRIPKFIKVMRLLVVPCVILPSKFGNIWKSLYAWQAISFHTKASLIGSKPKQGTRINSAQINREKSD